MANNSNNFQKSSSREKHLVGEAMILACVFAPRPRALMRFKAKRKVKSVDRVSSLLSLCFFRPVVFVLKAGCVTADECANMRDAKRQSPN
jgi:hypothetical protein